MADLAVRESVIPGLFEIDLDVRGDNRGWFKENYQREKMEALGLPRFEIVQNNFSFNAETGATRGLHMEPWVKFISVANGSVFAAWVDLRKGPGFGKTHTMTITPDKAAFVPLGVANGYQTLEAGVTYTYLVSAHWSPEVRYVGVNLYDPALGIAWPMGQNRAVVSEKDLANPMLTDVPAVEV